MFFKITDKDGNACNGGIYKYSLPNGNTPGEWTEEIPVNEIEICKRGYHLAIGSSLIYWMKLESPFTQRVFIAQPSYDPIVSSTSSGAPYNKAVAGQIRLMKEVRITDETILRAALCTIVYITKMVLNDTETRKTITQKAKMVYNYLTEQDMDENKRHLAKRMLKDTHFSLSPRLKVDQFLSWFLCNPKGIRNITLELYYYSRNRLRIPKNKMKATEYFASTLMYHYLMIFSGSIPNYPEVIEEYIKSIDMTDIGNETFVFDTEG